MKPEVGIWLVVVIPLLVNGEQNETHKSLLDIIPVIGDAKGLIQLLLGDKQGADQTFNTLYSEGLITSQVKSVVELFRGRSTEALETQKQFIKNLEPILDSIPVVGHLKGVTHILLGNSEHGWEAIKSASSATGTLVGAIFGGPIGALAGHLSADAAISGIESGITQEIKTHGLLEYAKNMKSASVGQHVDAAAGLLMDVIGGKATKNTKNPYTQLSLPKSSIELSEISIAKVENPIKQSSDGIENPFYKQIILHENKNKIHEREYEKFTQQEEFLHGTDIVDTFSNTKLFHCKDSINIQRPELIKLRNKLSYLSNDLRSQIQKSDFKTINTMNNDHASCSIAGVLDIDIESLHSNLVEPHKLPNRTPLSSDIFDSLNVIKNERYIDFFVTPTFKDIYKLNTYLKGSGKHLNSKPLIMELKKYDDSATRSVGLKFTFVNNEPELLLIDYQKPGLRTPGLPNPDRFIPFIDLIYKEFTLFSISPLKPFMLMYDRHVVRRTSMVNVNT